MIQFPGLGRLPMVIVACWATCGTGCDDAKPPRFPIRGIVTLNGQPIDNATVILTPKEKGLAASAQIQAGVFELPAEVGPNAGEYYVRINPNEIEVEEIGDRPAPANARVRIPIVYQQSGSLSATITGEPNQSLKFELKAHSK